MLLHSDSSNAQYLMPPLLKPRLQGDLHQFVIHILTII
jgi:hypothetical protein